MSIVLVCAALAGFALPVHAVGSPPGKCTFPAAYPAGSPAGEKEGPLRQPEDLHFEYRTGKFSDEDYQQLKTSLQHELALVMQNIEELEAPREAVGKRKATAAAEPAAATPSTGDARACPSCGHVNPASTSTARSAAAAFRCWWPCCCSPE